MAASIELVYTTPYKRGFLARQNGLTPKHVRLIKACATIEEAIAKFGVT